MEMIQQDGESTDHHCDGLPHPNYGYTRKCRVQCTSM